MSLTTVPAAFCQVPAIFGINPAFGPAGAAVTIGGTNFSATPSEDIVYFGPVRAAVNSASTTGLTVTVPSGAMCGPVSVNVNGLIANSDVFFQPRFLGNGTTLNVSNFSPRIDIGTGSGPTRIAVGDFDGDGKPDLAVANAYDHTIEIYQNISSNGTLSAGSFAAPVIIPFVGKSNADPYWLAAADVDGDGKLDLIAPDEASGQVIIYRNISSGGVLTSNSFAAPVAFNVGSTPRQVVVGDLDGDGRPDIVSANLGDNTISILRNIGTPGVIDSNSFAPQIVMATGSEPHDLAIGDLDGDGKPDLVINNYESPFVSIFRNISAPGTLNTNSFESRVDLPTPLYCSSVALGDLDGDGKLDIVFSASDGSDEISVYENLSTPGFLTTNSFAPRLDFPALGWVDGVTLGDLTGDGKLDIALVNQLPDSLSLFQNTGTGSFSSGSLGPRLDFSSGSNPYGVQIVDLDGDGRPDIVFVNTYSDTLSIYQNITPSLPQITSQPADQTVVVGGTASLSVTASGSPALTFQWFNGSGSIVGATGSTLTLSNVQPSETGAYYVTVSNPYGSTNSTSATLMVTNPPSSCTPVPGSIAAWWRGEDNANDSINGNDGTFEGNPSYTSGEVGQAFNFDGASYVLVPASTTLDFTNVMTVEAWVNLRSFSGVNDREIISKYGMTASDNVFTLSIDPTTQEAYFHIVSTNAASNLRINSSTTIPLNQWTHIAATVDGSHLNLYINGALSATLPWTEGIQAVTEPLTIGCTIGVGGPTSYFDGQVDEVSLYNQALSASEIAAIYNAGSAGKCVGELAPAITAEPTNESVVVGGTASFSVTANGSAPLEYQWYSGSNSIAGATSSTLTLSNVQLSAAGTYHATVSNPYGSITSSNATLTVTGAPPPSAAPPVIIGFNPVLGVPGNAAIINGSNFSATALSNIVYFGAVQAAVTGASTSNLTVTLPEGATFAPITETVDGLTAESGSPFVPTFPGTSPLSSSSLSNMFNLPMDNGPFGVAIGDLDGDGKPDLVVVNDYGSQIWIYRNIGANGDLSAASFAPPVILEAGSPIGAENIEVVRLADLAGDGRLDIVFANHNNSVVSVFQNLCTPGNITTNTFGPRLDFAVGSQPFSVAVADLDGDGKPELITGNYGDSTISILQNVSTGGLLTTNSFALPMTLPTPSAPSCVAAGDVDGDGKIDLVTANTGGGNTGVSIFDNTSTPGHISFERVDLADNQSQDESVAIGDIDGDGKQDLVIGSYTDSSFSVFRNIGTPGSINNSNSFAAPVTFAAGGPIHQDGIALADLDGDGKLDVAAVDQNSGLLYLYRNVSTPGSFTSSSLAAPITFTAGFNSATVAIGDLDADGRPDIVIANSYGHNLTIWKNVASTVTNPPPATAPPAILGFSPALGVPGNTVMINGSNFNATAADNIVYFGAVKAAVSSASTSNLVVTLPVGATYAPITETVQGLTGESINSFLPTFPGSSPLSSSSLSNMFNLASGNGPYGIAIGDIDGDGKPDVVFVNDYDGTVWIYRNISSNGILSAASFAPPVILPADSPVGNANAEGNVTLADLDGDGRLDIVFANWDNGVVSVFQNLSSPGNLTTSSFGPRLDFAVGYEPTSVAVADLDGDGKPEIIAAVYGTSTIAILRNISTPGLLTSNSFAAAITFATPPGDGPSQVAAGDVDGDGKIDLVTANHSSSANAVSIFDNTSTPGNISFAPRVDLPADASTEESVTIGDIDGDGKPDLIIGSAQSIFSVYRNIGSPGSITSNSFAAPVTFSAAGPIHRGGIALGDIDGDGKPDLAIVDQDSGNLYLYRNLSAPGSFTSSSLASPVTFASGYNSADVAVGDLNGDGRPDIVIANAYGDNLTVWENAVSTETNGSCTPPPSGIAGWWPANGNTDDVIGGNNGIASNVTYTNGEVGQAFVLNGAGSVSVPAASNLDIGMGSGITIEGWIEPASGANGAIAEWDSDSLDGLQLWVQTGGQLFANITGSTGGPHLVYTGSGVLSSSQFQHVAVTYDKASGNTILYVNGVVVASQNYPGLTPQTSYPAYHLNIGVRSASYVGTYYYTGLIDELSVYSRALASSEIAAIYNAGGAGKCFTGVPPGISAQPVNQNVAVGGTTSFFVGASGSPALRYQWYHGSNSIVGATNSLLVLSNVQPSEAGPYYATVSNPYGTTNSAIANLTVNFQPATLRVVDTTPLPPGTNVVTVPIDLVANGNENQVSFSLNFDTNRLNYLFEVAGSSPSGATLQANTSLVANGQLGIEIALPSGKTFTAGTHQILFVFFSTPPLTGTQTVVTPVSFGNQPTAEALQDTNGNPLAISLVNGTVTLSPSGSSPAVVNSQEPILTLSYSGGNALLSWPAWAGNFSLQAVGGLTPPVAWTNVPVTPVTNGGNVEVIVPSSAQQTFFRLYLP